MTLGQMPYVLAFCTAPAKLRQAVRSLFTIVSTATMHRFTSL
jgi:hypothetical protein